MPLEEALEIVREQAGTGLCPAAVAALEAALARGPDSSATVALGLPSGAMKVSVRLFAGLRERAGGRHIEVELPDGAVVADLLAAMAQTPVGELRPGSASSRSTASTRAPASRSARERRDRADPAGERRRRAVRAVRVTEEPLDLARSRPRSATRAPAPSSSSRASRATCPSSTTRPTPRWRSRSCARSARRRPARHGLCAVALEHRVGTVPLSEPSVVVAASAPHRGEAFAGARALIDRVKAEAPIWKVEVDGADRRRVEGTLPPTPETVCLCNA